MCVHFQDMECVVTTAVGCQIGNDPHGMRIVKVHKDKIMHEYHALDKFPKKVDLEGKEDS